MLYLPIREIEIFDQVDNHKSMIFSMRVDGEPIYGCAIAGSKPVSSCSGTVGAFESESRQSMVAWIDPASGRFVSIKSIFGFSLSGIAVFVPFCAIAIFRLTNIILVGFERSAKGQTTWDIPIMVALAGAALAGFVMYQFKLPSKLEIELRQQFENRRKPSDASTTSSVEV